MSLQLDCSSPHRQITALRKKETGPLVVNHLGCPALLASLVELLSVAPEVTIDCFVKFEDEKILSQIVLTLSVPCLFR